MNRRFRISLALALLVAAWAGAFMSASGAPPTETAAEEGQKTTGRRPTADEARLQAELLHEAMHATLQIVHHEYYREDEGLKIPAATLTQVFDEVARSRRVELRWLAVNAAPMNTDHVAKDDFEKDAVAALAAGKSTHEATADGVYRYAAPITLTSDCLKCHLPNRTSTKPRTAGLVIAIPIAGQ